MNLMHQGGFMMWPLLALSIAALAVMVERFITLTTTRFPDEDTLRQAFRLAHIGKTDEAVSMAADAVPAYRKFFAALFDNITPELHEQHITQAGEEALFSLSRRLDFLATVAAAAPLMGLLGTVIGMINAFSRLASSGSVDITMLSGGIWQALLTTAAGLSIAIPALLAHRLFCRMHAKAAFTLQKTAVDYLTTTGTQEPKP